MSPCDCIHWIRPPADIVRAGDESDGPGCRHPDVVPVDRSELGGRVLAWLHTRRGVRPGRSRP